jgi:hypothetical protein
MRCFNNCKDGLTERPIIIQPEQSFLDEINSYLCNLSVFEDKMDS